MLLRRTVGFFTAFLLLQSTLVAAGEKHCARENQAAASSTMDHETMSEATVAIAHSAVGSILTERMHGHSTMDNEAACVLMSSCTSTSEIPAACVAQSPIQAISSHIVLSALAPLSRGTTPDVPPPRK